MLADGGLGHFATVDDDGRVWLAGNIGKSAYNNRFLQQPKQIQQLCNISNVSCGNAHLLALSTQGKVWGLGSNSFGQLGVVSSYQNVSTPTKIKGIPEIKSINCGGFHSILIDTNSNPWCFGSNSEYQLGLGFREKKVPKPSKLTSLENLSFACAGRWFSCFVDYENNFYFAGKLDSTFTSPTKIAFADSGNIINIFGSYSFAIILFDNGNIYYFTGSKNDTPKKIEFPNKSRIKSVACAASSIIVLDDENKTFHVNFKKNPDTDNSGYVLDITEFNALNDEDVLSIDLLASSCYYYLLRTTDGSIFITNRDDMSNLSKMEEKYNSILCKPVLVQKKSARK